MENLKEYQRDPYFEKFINLTVDFITSEVKDRLKEFKPIENDTLALTPAEAAKQIGVSKTVMYNDLLKREDFPSYRLNSKYYISKKGLEEWVQAQINKR